MKWVTLVLAILLFLAPFVLGYSAVPAALWASLVLAVAIGIAGLMEGYRWAAGFGLLTFVAPWVLGFSGIGAAYWSCLILGALVVILAGYRGWLSGKQEGQTAHTTKA